MKATPAPSAPVSSWRTYRRLLAFARPYRLLLMAALVAALVEAAGTTGFLALMKPITDETFIYKNAEISRWLPVQIILLFVIRGVAGYVTDMAMGKSARSIARDLRVKVMSKYLRLPGSRFDTEPVPSMLVRLGSDSDQVAQAAVDAVKVMVQQSLQVIGALALMLWHSWQVTLTILVLAPVLAWVMDKVARRYRRISHNIQESGAQLLQAADQTLSSHQEVKIYGAQQTEMQRYAGLADRNLRLAMKVESTRGISTATVQMIGAIGLSALLFVAGAQAMAGNLTAGDFVVLMTSMLTIIPGLKQLTNVQNMVQRGLASAERLFSVLDSDDERDAGTRPLARTRGRIEFRDVTARYPGQVRPALIDVSFVAEPGTVTAIVGRSGSGKSSLIKLIPRFYEPESGQILLDGHSVDDYPLADLRRQIALVGQQVMLVDGSIGENVAYGELREAAPAQLQRAIEGANAQEFVEQLPDGLQAQVGTKGGRLSGGQRQ
ncbi:ATP-binding cassette domain-containing protein, partial [Xanthomonas sp. Kuri4-2]